MPIRSQVSFIAKLGLGKEIGAVWGHIWKRVGFKWVLGGDAICVWVGVGMKVGWREVRSWMWITYSSKKVQDCFFMNQKLLLVWI